MTPAGSLRGNKLIEWQSKENQIPWLLPPLPSQGKNGPFTAHRCQ